MTIKRQRARELSGIALLALFLSFLFVTGYLAAQEEKPVRGNFATIEAAIAEPVAIRNSTKPNFTPGYCLKAAGPCLLLALFALTIISPPTLRVSALKINLSKHNPFYVFVSTNAP